MDQCLKRFMRNMGLDQEDKDKILFITCEAKVGPEAMIVPWAKEHGYDWVEFVPKWDDIDAEGSVIRVKNGREYNALAKYWCDEEMAEVCTHGISFYDGVSSGTQDMIDNVSGRGSPCGVYLVTIEEDDEDNDGEESRRR